MSSKIDSGGDPGTHVLILEAGLEILLGDAPERLSMADVASRAGVSRQAVYLHFANRNDLVVSIVDFANERLGLAKRLEPLARARTGRHALEVFVDVIVWQTSQVGPAVRAVNRLVERDPELAAKIAERSGRLARIEQVVDLLSADRQLRRGLRRDQATTLLYAMTLPDPVLACLNAGYGEQKVARLLHGAIERALCSSRPPA